MIPYAVRVPVTTAGQRGVEEARRAIADWLLGDVQLTVTPHVGGVAGAIDGNGGALYVYPEASGYYLQWLAWMASRRTATPALARRADAAQRWLASWIACPGMPETRVHLRAHAGDWRNAALFCFDLAMVLRGVASATAARLIEPDRALLQRLFAHLSQLIDRDQEFVACVVPSGVAIPNRWSTRRGGFLSKAAAAVLSAARILPQVPATLRAAAETTLAMSIRAAVERPHDETHPRLYAIEGVLILSPLASAPVPTELARQLVRLIDSATLHGALSESEATGSVERLDIVAQGLRAAYLLRAIAPRWAPDERAMERMQHLLVRYTSPDGAVAFDTGVRPKRYCVWAAMFAEQALALARMRPAEVAQGETAAHLV
jgi:hypothetical protein